MSTLTTKNSQSEVSTRNVKFGMFLAFCAPIAVAAILGKGMLYNMQISSDAIQCTAAYKAPTSWFTSLKSQAETVELVANEDQESLWNPRTLAWLTPEQIQLLSMSYDIGYRDGGESHAKLVQAVLLQETIAGQISRIGHLSAPVGKRSYGVMQMKVTAARDVLQRHPEFGKFDTDEELITRLVADDALNISMASKFLKFMRSKTLNDQKALVAYNIGLRASRTVDDASDFRYVKNVDEYLDQVVEPYNEKFGKDPNSVTRM